MGPGSPARAAETMAGHGALTLVPTFVVVAVDATGMGIILPLLPFYSQRLGATPFLLGALISAYAVCQLIAGPVVGILSDRYGRRKVLLVSQIGTLAGFVLLALAGNLALVFLARIIDGLTSGNISVAHAYAAEHSAPATRKQALGMTSGAIGTGLLLGPALSSLLVHYGQTAPVWAAAALSLISVVATIALLPPDHPASEPLYQHRVPEPTLTRSLFGMHYAWRLLGLLIVFFFVNSMFLSQIGLFLSARFSWDGRAFGARELGWIFAYAGFINMVVQGLLMTRVNLIASDRSIVMAAFACMTLGFAGLGAENNVGLLVVNLTLIIVGTMFARSTLTAELSRSTAINRQGMIMGLNQSLMSGANISAPLLSGALIGHRLFVPWALVMAAIAAVGAALAGQLLDTQRAR
ncbi:MFS transporter [Bradyrhizobium sacchari]|uniref:Putative MFS family arabinose efflux permease n=1 Tax=Bradyrhizobium sacchari TaxID=1399419 RepID=A0A560KMG5_9BRAD|nr:MFS transporter [Bradyrhizobium sacchari]OPY96439.1 MFS transporter [Bradyrhizobium sacchari]TWB67198.1 putative MFS family arabinose efflux permease [Bradyrhizobium sacchari]TWB84435.1 putative MFS family arabinose efflux permease [Bradyrhizobium sacchari]